MAKCLEALAYYSHKVCHKIGREWEPPPKEEVIFPNNMCFSFCLPFKPTRSGQTNCVFFLQSRRCVATRTPSCSCWPVGAQTRLGRDPRYKSVFPKRGLRLLGGRGPGTRAIIQGCFPPRVIQILFYRSPHINLGFPLRNTFEGVMSYPLPVRVSRWFPTSFNSLLES